MREELVSFQTAKLAKEKGFNLKTHDYFSKDKYEKELSEKIGFDDEYWGNNYLYDWNTNGEPFKPFNKECYSAPTQTLLQRWLREVHDIDINIEPVATGYGFYIHKNGDYIHNAESYGVYRNTYEKILEIGLQEALKLIK